MTLPRSAAVPAAAAERGVGGFWYELADADDRVLYRRETSDPRRPLVEQFAADGSITGVELERTEAVFDVLVPDVDGETELRLFAAPDPVADAGKGVVSGVARLAALRLPAADAEGAP